ncbi:hypothetical protein [Helicobacter mustelae]|nr:hypothetical protein [Helicobacter mustelae]
MHRAQMEFLQMRKTGGILQGQKQASAMQSLALQKGNLSEN